MELDQEQIETAAQWVREAQAILITAGAGMGVDSGLPDFRGPEGLWRAYPALRNGNWNFQDIASPQAFRTRPGLAWGFYAHRLAMYRAIQPHAGFGMLLSWGKRAPKGYRVFTSNVDGHFQKAAFEDFKVVECHGSINALQCSEPCCDEVWSAEVFQPKFLDEAKLELAHLPHCPVCGRLARPNVLMFNDYGWIDRPAEQKTELFSAWAGQNQEGLLVIEVGAGTAIPTVRRLGEHIAHRLIRINLREAKVMSSPNTLSLPGTALDTLSRIDQALL